MNEISDLLKRPVPFIDVNLKETVLNLTISITTAPYHLTPILDELKLAVFRYDDLSKQWSVNVTDVFANSTENFIYSDNKIVEAIEHDPAYFNDPTKLTAACAVIDTVRNIAEDFTGNITRTFLQTKLAVMPNEQEIIAELVGLTNDLSEAKMTDFRDAHITDFQPFVNRVHELIQRVQLASDFIERNTQSQIVQFGTEIDFQAFDAEGKLRRTSECFAGLLPDEVRP